jgi:fumarate hydratase class II
MQVPADALYGAQTQRAVENFPISDLRFPRSFIAALGTIKRAAAETNVELELLDGGVAAAIVRRRTRWPRAITTRSSCSTSSRRAAARRRT